MYEPVRDYDGDVVVTYVVGSGGGGGVAGGGGITCRRASIEDGGTDSGTESAAAATAAAVGAPLPSPTPSMCSPTARMPNGDLGNHHQQQQLADTGAKRPSGMGDNCVDIDHINLERNYKNKGRAVAVQTSHLLPYRLRFWPPSASANIKCIDGGIKDIVKCCLRTLSQWFLSQIGLTLILIMWALIGAAAFYKTEGPKEKEQADELERMKREIAIDLVLDSHSKDLMPEDVEAHLKRHEQLLLHAVTAGYGEGGGGQIWTYPGCILFAVSLLTTLGFGAPVPRTPLGRGSAVLFSAIGIPLHFLLILNMGNLAAGKLQNLATIRKTSDGQDIPTRRRSWLKWFPVFAVAFYYILGVICFGLVRRRPIVDSLMFPLDFTASGGVAKTLGHVRILYALYLEVAMTLAGTIVALIQASASRGIIDLGLRMGLLINT